MLKFKSVLLIDDDPVSNFVTDTMCRKLDICSHTDICRNGAEALNLLKNHTISPDLIFLDIKMPVMDGLEFLDNYYSSDLGKNTIPIIVYTTLINEEEKKKCKGLPIMFKPFTREKLEAAMSVRAC